MTLSSSIAKALSTIGSWLIDKCSWVASYLLYWLSVLCFLCPFPWREWKLERSTSAFLWGMWFGPKCWGTPGGPAWLQWTPSSTNTWNRMVRLQYSHLFQLKALGKKQTLKECQQLRHTVHTENVCQSVVVTCKHILTLCVCVYLQPWTVCYTMCSTSARSLREAMFLRNIWCRSAMASSTRSWPWSSRPLGPIGRR